MRAFIPGLSVRAAGKFPLDMPRRKHGAGQLLFFMVLALDAAPAAQLYVDACRNLPKRKIIFFPSPVLKKKILRGAQTPPRVPLHTSYRPSLQNRTFGLQAGFSRPARGTGYGVRGTGQAATGIPFCALHEGENIPLYFISLVKRSGNRDYERPLAAISFAPSPNRAT